jgi:type I restriction enzyme S subunit
MVKLKLGWKLVKLGDVVDVVTDYWDRDPTRPERFVAGEHIDEGDLRVRRWGMTNDELVPPTFNRRFKSRDVLFHSRNLRKIVVPDFDGITGEKLFVLRPLDEQALMQDFLPFILQTSEFYEYTEKMWAGSTNKFLNKAPLVRFEFPLPPIKEQRRLVEILSVSEQALNANRALADQARILHMSTVDILVSAAFKNAPRGYLNDFVDQSRPITYGILKPGTGFPNGVPVIKVRDFPDGEILTNDLLLTDPTIDQEYRRSRLRAGDLLISIRGTIGRLAFVPVKLENANITQDTARLSIREGYNSKFVRVLLESSILRSQIRSNTTGLAVQGLNIGELRRLKVPILPQSAQDRIADIADVTKITTISADRRTRDVGALKYNLLREIFRGQ